MPRMIMLVCFYSYDPYDNAFLKLLPGNSFYYSRETSMDVHHLSHHDLQFVCMALPLLLIRAALHNGHLKPRLDDCVWFCPKVDLIC